MRYLRENPEREAAVVELLESRHIRYIEQTCLEIAIFMALALLRRGESAHRAIDRAEAFLKNQAPKKP